MENHFNYTYSAKTNSEVEQIRQKYLPPDQNRSKLEQLHQLDRSCEIPGTVAAVAVGVTGMLTLGGGMALLMETAFFVPGLILGILGLGIMAVALPLYRRITEQRRKQIAPEILRLSQEILQDKEKT